MRVPTRKSHWLIFWGTFVFVSIVVATSIFLGSAVDENCSAEGAQKSEECVANAPGLNIPWAIGGERYERDGALVNFPGEWPDFHVPSLRIWDARVAWLDLEPSDDGWNFDRLDRIVDKAQEQGVEEIVMVLSGTPQWASTEIRPTDAFWRPWFSVTTQKSFGLEAVRI